MSAHDPLSFLSFLTPRLPEPIPADHAEPLERLLEALHSGSALLLLSPGEGVQPGWLTAARIETHLHQALLGPAQAQTWPLLEGVWAISVRVAGEPNDFTRALHLHGLRCTLAERLEAEWRSEADEEKRRRGEEEIAPSPRSFQPPLFTLLPVGPLVATEEIQENIAELNALLEIIVNKQLHAQFQPIVSLRDGQVFGYEALIRGPKGAPLRRSGAMYRAADKAHMIAWYDIACLDRCFARAAEQGLKRHLFVNMDAAGLAYLDVAECSLSQRARDHGLSPGSIVVEVTERQAVSDFPRLMQYIERLREEGFKIAIDDAGAGYNSLHTIAELRPDFVKIDRSLVQNIDVTGERRALLYALAQYARHIGTAVLAEGSETREELAALIDLGIPYGQGYLMGKPADDFRGVPRETREFIQQHAHQRRLVMVGRSVTVGGLARKGLALPLETPLSDAAQRFLKDLSLTSVVVVEEGFARGLLMREQLEHVLAMADMVEAADMLPAETVGQWMRTNMLCAEEEASVTEIARQVTTHSDLSLETDIVVVRSSGEFVGVLPTRTLLEVATTIQENRQRHTDALTGLPGQVPLEQRLQERLDARRSLAVIRTDIRGLEAYNRRYGIAHGDEALLALARLLQDVAAAQGRPDDFLAHLGGGDFVLVTEASAALGICRALTSEFDRLAARFYTSEHVRQGFMEVEERGGMMRRVPLFTLAVAAVTNRTRRLTACGPILEELRELLARAKRHSGSYYALDIASEKAPQPGERR